MTTSQAPESPAVESGRTARVASVDVLRGIVVVLMAIDHVRVFSGLPAGGPTLGIFFTRWITHFVAPVFVFLAGTAAFLHGRKLGDRRKLAAFLLTRGLLLILLELTVIRIAWTFNFDFSSYLLAGVIWVIGWSMVLLAPLVFLPTWAVGAVGVAIIVGHNVLDYIARPNLDAISASDWSWAWQVGYFAFEAGTTGPFVVLYSLVPWIGVMAAGYAFGAVFALDAARRRRICFLIGGAATAGFIILRALDSYGDPRPWRTPATPPAPVISGAQPTAGAPAPTVTRPPTSWFRPVRSFLNTTKYPASLHFLLMTLGPALLILPFLEQPGSVVTRALEVFGRVPMFYYLIHIPLIHVLAIGVSLLRTGSVDPWLFQNHPMEQGPAPEGYTWKLWVLYLVTGIAVGVLYIACRWYDRVKRTSRNPWLSYL